jgi:predicted trehalose synthase
MRLGHDVYVHFGRAVHEAQLLELDVQGLAMQLDLGPNSEEAFDEAWARIENLFRRTIGYVQDKYDIPSEVADELESARRARNFLAHEFFRQPDLHTGGARAEDAAIEMLDQLARSFHALGERLEALTRALAGEKPLPGDEAGDF